MERVSDDQEIPPGHTLEVGQSTGISRHYINGRWDPKNEQSCPSTTGTVFSINNDGDAFISCDQCDFSELAYKRY